MKQQAGFNFQIAPMDPACVSPSGIGKVSPSADPTAKHCSRMGAEDVVGRAEAQRERLFNTYTVMGPQTDQEMADFLGIDRSSVIPRRTELMEAGRVQKIGWKRNDATGVANTTWGCA